MTMLTKQRDETPGKLQIGLFTEIAGSCPTFRGIPSHFSLVLFGSGGLG